MAQVKRGQSRAFSHREEPAFSGNDDEVPTFRYESFFLFKFLFSTFSLPSLMR
jgi:hypothetical protein